MLVLTGDPIGLKMAGPGIRAWHIARELSVEHDVRLVSSSGVEPLVDSPPLFVVLPRDRRSMAVHERWADVVILQGHGLDLFPAIETSKKPVVVDLYDPMHLEQLERGVDEDDASRTLRVSAAVATLDHAVRRGDFFLCANERQRLFWLGALASAGRINPHTRHDDPELRGLLAIVPFGLPTEAPTHLEAVLRGRHPAIEEGDVLVIWAGGLYEWFDPATLVRAAARTRAGIRVIFLAGTNPNSAVGPSRGLDRLRTLAQELGVLGTSVIFVDEWIDYLRRADYLLESDIGVSTHRSSLETEMSFRTRILDYLWAGLPIITTEGDGFADLVRERGAGIVVGEGAVDELADALERLAFDRALRRHAQSAVEQLRREFAWPDVVAPLLGFLLDPRVAPDRIGREGRRRMRPPKHRTGWRRDIVRVLEVVREEGRAGLMLRVERRRRTRSDGGERPSPGGGRPPAGAAG